MNHLNDCSDLKAGTITILCGTVLFLFGMIAGSLLASYLITKPESQPVAEQSLQQPPADTSVVGWDIPANYWAEEDARFCLKNKLMLPLYDNAFDGKKLINRIQIAYSVYAMMQLLGYKEKVQSEDMPVIADLYEVPTEMQESVKFCVRNKFMHLETRNDYDEEWEHIIGTTPNCFSGKKLVNRYQIAVVLKIIVDNSGKQMKNEDYLRLNPIKLAAIQKIVADNSGKQMKNEDYTQSDRLKFSDYDESYAWAQESIDFCVHNRLLQGFDGKFHGMKLLNRYQIAVIWCKLLSRFE
jgi:hypothetical protein